MVRPRPAQILALPEVGPPAAGVRPFEARERPTRLELGQSSSLPALRQALPPSKQAIEPLPGRGGLNKLVIELIASAEREMRVYGVPRHGGGHSDARLAIWGGALRNFSEHLPSSQKLLSRVMAEFDAAIEALIGEVRAAEARASATWLAEQRAEQRASRAERTVTAMHARRGGEPTNASAPSAAPAPVAIGTPLSPSGEEQRLEDAIDRLPVDRRRVLLLRALQGLGAADRSAVFVEMVQPGWRKADYDDELFDATDGANEELSPAAADTAEDVARSEAAMEDLLGSMPERTRQRLGRLTFESLSTDAREATFRALRALAAGARGGAREAAGEGAGAGGAGAASQSNDPAELAEMLRAAQAEARTYKKALARLHVRVHENEARAAHK